MGHFEVRVAVANDPRSGQVQRMLARSTLEQTWVRFSAFADVFRFVRAKVNRVDPGASGCQFRNHFLVDFVHERFRKNVSRNPGLVRYDDHRNLRLIQLADRIGGKWEDLKAVDVIDVAHFLTNCSVAVQKHCAP